jgi:hypothetical protein
MRKIWSLALIFLFNGAYLFISYNMESMISEADSDRVEEVVVSSIVNMEFDPADIMDLELLDFDVDELMNGKQPNTVTKRSPHLVHDRV